MSLVYDAIGCVLCLVAVVAFWWETHGRRGWERELWRREMRARKPRR